MVHMDPLDVSRWQFGITTVYHFIFVPLTIGLAPLLAIMQTVWVVTDNPAWYRLTRFFGKLFLINFALGVATGIVQVFTNNTGLAAFAHVISAPLQTAGTFVAGGSAWWRGRARGEQHAAALF